MKILLLTQWFDPEPTFKGQAFARALHQAGHEVEVITGFPNYPGGKLYPGYRLRWRQRETIDGVRVLRVPLYPSHDGSALGRVFNYLTFALASCLAGLFLARRPDVIYSYHPPLTTSLSGLVIARLRRVPVVNDIQDLWPDTLRATGMIRSARVLALVARVCRVVYAGVDALVVLSPGFRRRLIERGVPEEKVEVIYNWCDEQALSIAARGPAPEAMRDRINVVFAGTMGKAQALDAVLDAARLVAPRDARVQFVFVGGGIEVERLKARVVAEGAPNVIFLPRMPMNEVGTVLGAADALLVHLKDDPLFAITVPSKTQAYMAVGKPVIMAVRGDAADLIERSGGGVVAEPEHPESIAAAVLDLAARGAEERAAIGARAAHYYFEHMSLPQGIRQFERVFTRLIQSRR
jgi:colanic acid biosynthesis glycosyl transferase WcaI